MRLLATLMVLFRVFGWTRRATFSKCSLLKALRLVERSDRDAIMAISCRYTTDEQCAAAAARYCIQVCYYASAQRSVAAGGILFLACSSVRPCVRLETLLTRDLAEYLNHFHQTYVSNALWDRDERFTIWSQKVEDQGYGGLKYAGNSTFWACC